MRDDEVLLSDAILEKISIRLKPTFASAVLQSRAISWWTLRSGPPKRPWERIVQAADPGFWSEFNSGAVGLNIKPGKSMAKIQKSLFKVCHELVRKWYVQNDSDNALHAALIALFMFNFWNATGLLPMAQALVIYGPKV